MPVYRGTLSEHEETEMKEREKYRLAKFVQRRDGYAYLPEVELTANEFDIDYSWVLAQRDKQGNRCFYTGREMV